MSGSYLRLPCGTVGQELFKDGGEDLRDEVVAQVFEDAGAPLGHHVSQCRRLSTLFHQPGEPCCEIPPNWPCAAGALTGGSYNANLGMVSP